MLKSLSPHGESGLKYETLILQAEREMSLPARGEWIEIPDSSVPAPCGSVSPRTGRVD